MAHLLLFCKREKIVEAWVMDELQSLQQLDQRIKQLATEIASLNQAIARLLKRVDDKKSEQEGDGIALSRNLPTKAQAG